MKLLEKKDDSAIIKIEGLDLFVLGIDSKKLIKEIAEGNLSDDTKENLCYGVLTMIYATEGILYGPQVIFKIILKNDDLIMEVTDASQGEKEEEYISSIIESVEELSAHIEELALKLGEVGIGIEDEETDEYDEYEDKDLKFYIVFKTLDDAIAYSKVYPNINSRLYRLNNKEYVMEIISKGEDSNVEYYIRNAADFGEVVIGKEETNNIEKHLFCTVVPKNATEILSKTF